MKQTLTLILLALLTFACGETSKQKEQASKVEHKDEITLVMIAPAEKGMFYKEFENNGSLMASRSATLMFEQTGDIKAIRVKNGERVKQGDILAEVEDSQQTFAYQKALRSRDNAQLSLEEALLNQGYSWADSASIPEAVMKMALIRSGYQDAENAVTVAKYDLDKTKVRAPFSGVVADLKAKSFNQTSSFENKCCNLIDDRTFEVEMLMLESEMSEVERGLEVLVIPYAVNDTIVGKLTEINPKVNENGMVAVKASVANKNGELAEGMNVKVLVRKPKKNSIIIPKEAITIRQERNVVFVARNDTAHWRYVDVQDINSRYAQITKGVKAGENVVIEGQFNLSHLAPISVIK